METESSSEDTGAEGASATWVPTMHLLFVPWVGCTRPLTLASFSDRRREAAEATAETTLETPLSWAGSHLALGKNVFLFSDSNQWDSTI